MVIHRGLGGIFFPTVGSFTGVDFRFGNDRVSITILLLVLDNLLEEVWVKIFKFRLVFIVLIFQR